MIRDCLNKAGYANLRMFPNGRELWEALNALPQGDRLADQVA